MGGSPSMKSLMYNIKSLLSLYEEYMKMLLKSFKQNMGGHICLVLKVYRIFSRWGISETWYIYSRDHKFF